jgi:hypothetical protein
MQFSLQHKQKAWLLVTAFVVGSFGPVFSLATTSALDGPARWTLDVLAWPIDGAQVYSNGAMRFLTALTGGFLFGWGMMILALRHYVYDAAPEPTRRAVVIGLVCWFILDSIGSVAADARSNVIFNIVVLVTAVGPLWRPAREKSSTPYRSSPVD